MSPAAYLALLWLRHRGRGWPAALGGFLVVALALADYVLKRKHRDEIRGEDPYTPPTHITR